MNGAFYIGATGLEVQQRNLDTIAQNVANINTRTYKRAEQRFAELVSQVAVPSSPDELAQPQSADLAGVRISRTVRVFSQGALNETGKPLDLAISGDGFVEVLGPGGQAWLWRGGSLKVDADGVLGTADGLQLKTLIQVPDGITDIRIGRDGRVQGLAQGDENLTELGQLELVQPDDVDRLQPVDGGYYLADEGTQLRSYLPGETGQGVFVQGSLEASNVDISTELVSMLLTQRAYGAAAQVVQAGDQLMSIANGLRR
ncbi:flagellar hook-basal body protein [Novosphingobium sp. B 225]|uniref:flagellar hook-basal body protein n=1 Tax=Novosphingobium sp. B 225 TaxID=1961849 RepID=UPI000B4A90B0|nr:flagellar hook-basal body protein [Novosphingobium sp. B 225]